MTNASLRAIVAALAVPTLINVAVLVCVLLGSHLTAGASLPGPAYQTHRPALQLCQWVDSAGNGHLYRAYHC